MSTMAARMLRLVLALAFCLQSSLAMAHCARLSAPAQDASQPFLMVICTSQGLVTVDMSEPGEERRDAPQQAMVDFCLACHVLPGMDLPMPVEVPAPRLQPAEAPTLVRMAVLPLGARAPPYRPTAPPAFS